MQCPVCGYINSVDALFCCYCGNSLPSFNGNRQPVTEGDIIMVLDRINLTIGNRRIGGAKDCGLLKIYVDRLKFDRQYERMLGAFSMPAKQMQSIEYYYTDIASCYYSVSRFNTPYMTVNMKTGEQLNFSCAGRQVEIADAVSYVNQAMNGVTPQAVVDDGHAFVMTISNCIPIKEQQSAVVGSVVKGSVYIGMNVSVIGSDNEVKGTFEVRSLAVNKMIAQQAFEGNQDVALLLPCHASVVRFGDRICG